MILETKLLQKTELNKDDINSMLEKAIRYFFEEFSANKECDLDYEIIEIEGAKVEVKFTWIKDLINHDIKTNSWDKDLDNFITTYNFSKDHEALLDEIVEELGENVRTYY